MREKIPSKMHFLTKVTKKKKENIQNMDHATETKKEYLASNEDKSPPGI